MFQSNSLNLPKKKGIFLGIDVRNKFKCYNLQGTTTSKLYLLFDVKDFFLILKHLVILSRVHYSLQLSVTQKSSKLLTIICVHVLVPSIYSLPLKGTPSPKSRYEYESAFLIQKLKSSVFLKTERRYNANSKRLWTGKTLDSFDVSLLHSHLSPNTAWILKCN